MLRDEKPTKMSIRRDRESWKLACHGCELFAGKSHEGWRDMTIKVVDATGIAIGPRDEDLRQMLQLHYMDDAKCHSKRGAMA